jgi:two-component system chemotaxis sensor kinase CheA
MNLDQALQTFFAESRELLDAMEATLLTLGQECDPETINAIFRAAHTIKGSAGLFGLDAVVAFTHVVESVLDEVREGRVAIAPVWRPHPRFGRCGRSRREPARPRIDGAR